MKKTIAVAKIALIALWTIPLLTLQIVVLLFTKGSFAYHVPCLWHKGICAIIGLRTQIVGQPVTDRQIIYISNHVSYLDIPAMGSHLKASFIAKEDIAHWPVIGYLASVQQTAFISRSSSKAKKVANALDAMLKAGKNLILFPEGTSTDGVQVAPFKSSLFALALQKDIPPIAIQPYVIEVIDADGQKVDAGNRDNYAWYADMEFAPHIWLFLQTSGGTVRLTFLDVIMPSPNQDRKELCQLVEQQISSGLNPS